MVSVLRYCELRVRVCATLISKHRLLSQAFQSRCSSTILANPSRVLDNATCGEQIDEVTSLESI
jgi:hypothetical protein